MNFLIDIFNVIKANLVLMYIKVCTTMS